MSRASRVLALGRGGFKLVTSTKRDQDACSMRPAARSAKVCRWGRDHVRDGTPKCTPYHLIHLVRSRYVLAD